MARIIHVKGAVVQCLYLLVLFVSQSFLPRWLGSEKQGLLRVAFQPKGPGRKAVYSRPLLLTISQHRSLGCLSFAYQPWALVQKLLSPLSGQKAFCTIDLETDSEFLLSVCLVSQGLTVHCEQTIHRLECESFLSPLALPACKLGII